LGLYPEDFVEFDESLCLEDAIFETFGENKFGRLIDLAGRRHSA